MHPHPALRATFSQREKDTSLHSANLDTTALGEGGAKRRVRAEMRPHPTLRATFSQREKDSFRARPVFPIVTSLPHARLSLGHERQNAHTSIGPENSIRNDP